MDNRSIIQSSIDYIEANLKSQLSAAELAGRAGFSLFHYCRVFAAETGLPVMQYVLRRRLLYAIYEMKNGGKRIDIILEYGFDSYSGYYRAFRREFGCTPSAYLRQNRARRPWKLNLLKEEHRYMNITHKKAAEALKHWNLEQLPVTDIYFDSTGNRHDRAFYAGDSYVLKFAPSRQAVQGSITLAKAMKNLGLYTAAPIPTLQGEDGVDTGEAWFYLTPRLTGSRTSAKAYYGQDGAAKARFAGEMIGQIDLALSKTEAQVKDADLYSGAVNWALPKAKAQIPLPEGLCQDFKEAMDRLCLKLPRQIIHRDLNPGNLLLTETGWGVLDFEQAEKNVRLYDLCYAATGILVESFDSCDQTKWPEICRQLLYGYDSVLHLLPEEWEAFPYIILANQLICVAWFAEQEQYPELFDTNKRMTLWLAEHFEQLRQIR